jgi:hypothetical protein
MPVFVGRNQRYGRDSQYHFAVWVDSFKAPHEVLHVLDYFMDFKVNELIAFEVHAACYHARREWKNSTIG